MDAQVAQAHGLRLDELPDAEVDVTGAVAGRFDSKAQLTGILIEVASPADLKIVRPAEARPESIPVTPMNEILSASDTVDRSKRVRVEGTVTYAQPGSAVVLQSGRKSLWISTHREQPLQIGELAEATGFPDVQNGELVLTKAEIRGRGTAAPVTPFVADWNSLATGEHAFELVSTEGTVLMSVREEEQDEYVLTAGGHLFSAIYRHPNVETNLAVPAMRQVQVGARVRVQGIGLSSWGSNPLRGPVAFQILLRNFDDLTLVEAPSWLTVQHLLLVLSGVLILLLGLLAWNTTLNRKVERQSAELQASTQAEAARNLHSASLEKRRSRILEQINGSEPLTAILAEITELVTFRLGGAPCWCELNDGVMLGALPASTEGLQLESVGIQSRNGPAQGVMYAALSGDEAEPEAVADSLSMGARMATLAIETRRAYLDLVYRSEFDLLTELHNRFSLAKRMEGRLAEAREHGRILGLIYLDLDDFKLVNDRYGHRIGDQYLQEVAVHMKRQLRSVDTLARMGGDEFAVLVPDVRSRSVVEEIAHRLEHCLDEPIMIDGHSLTGSASVGIALFPEDGREMETLLSAADHRMYMNKKLRADGQPPATRS